MWGGRGCADNVQWHVQRKLRPLCAHYLRPSSTHQVDLYTTWGKIWSCGGVGQCGTCIVKVRAAQCMPKRSDAVALRWPGNELPAPAAPLSSCRTPPRPRPKVDEGAALLSERTATEERKLKGVRRCSLQPRGKRMVRGGARILWRRQKRVAGTTLYRAAPHTPSRLPSEAGQLAAGVPNHCG